MKIQTFCLLTFALFMFASCRFEQKKSASQVPKINATDSLQTEEKVVNKYSWRNPMMCPYGTDLVRLVRGYYLVGDFDKMQQFVIAPPCYAKNELDAVFRKAKWGYDIRVNHVQWKNKEAFVLHCKTTKNNTTGVEQYLGKIIHDTAKLYLFPEKENLFQYFDDDDVNQICRYKKFKQ
ncbi:MAG: hypothetical protein EBS34_10320 [Flavobacteriales bacterium]|nr:hypothetical protein [Flavobacteriales bacterium]